MILTALFAVPSLFLTISADSSLLRLFRPAASLIPSLSSSPPGRLKHVVGLWRHACGATSSRLQCSQCQSRYWSKGYRLVDLFALELAALALTAGLVSLLLFELGVDLAFTDVDAVYENFGSSNQKRVSSLTKMEAEKLHDEGLFQKGSIAPKIRAAIHFLKHHGNKVIITSIPHIEDALNGSAGTEIRNEA